MTRFPIALGALAVLCGATTANDGVAFATTYVESFSGTDEFLTGALKPSNRGSWAIKVDEGIAWFSNNENNSALRYYDLPSVPVAFMDDPVPTDAAQIEASVTVEDAPDGGAGIMVGHPRGVGYLVFAVGSDQRFRVLRREDGRLTSLESGTNNVIAAEGFNRIRVERRVDRTEFYVNGTEVFRLDVDDDVWTNAPVGIAVFGRGRFGFDEVRIEPDGVAETAIREAARNSCGLPTPKMADHLVTLGVYEGQAISSLSLAGLDGVTSSAILDIESGEEPLYLVVNSYDSLLWRLQGNTERVAHLAVIGPTRDVSVASGVVGIPANKVSFHAKRDCVPYSYEVDSASFRQGNALLALWTGRAPTATLGVYDLNAMSIPSGATAEVEAPMGIAPEWDSAIVEEALRFTPAGVYVGDADTVVTDATVTKLKTLPQQFGLAQLLASGKLVRDGQSFRVTATMRYPAGLAGAHSVDFIIEPGVPEPTGNPGHSRVVRLEGGDESLVSKNLTADPTNELQ